LRSAADRGGNCAQYSAKFDGLKTTMGNQREIIQIEPRKCHGAAIRIRIDDINAIQALIEKGHFYTNLCLEGKPVEFPNMGDPDTHLGYLSGNYLTIQSGGKMWCGYEAFVEHIRALSPFLEDALFYVGDEEDCVDEFRIQAGELHYQRVYEGSGSHLQSYLASKGLA
jgi:hypothetical protein